MHLLGIRIIFLYDIWKTALRKKYQYWQFSACLSVIRSLILFLRISVHIFISYFSNLWQYICLDVQRATRFCLYIAFAFVLQIDIVDYRYHIKRTCDVQHFMCFCGKLRHTFGIITVCQRAVELIYTYSVIKRRGETFVTERVFCLLSFTQSRWQRNCDKIKFTRIFITRQNLKHFSNVCFFILFQRI